MKRSKYTLLKANLLTYFRLGFYNIFRVIKHQVYVKSGVYKKLNRQYFFCDGPFFNEIVSNDEVLSDTSSLLYYRPFHASKEVDFTKISWDYNILTNECFSFDGLHWSDISKALNGRGDVKGVWELSRLNWSVNLALTGSKESICILNKTLHSWTRHNRPYFGVNWVCGQEAAYRVLNLACSAYLLNQLNKSNQRLIDLINIHVERIEQTISYAIAQDNNHSITESAALYIGGVWLLSQGHDEGKRWAEIGRKILESRAAKLIGDDGSFSMFSTNYHRCVLDVFSLVEITRRHFGDKLFSPALYKKVELATLWLYCFVQQPSGQCPNLGANDGTLLFALKTSKYCDFRQTIQLSAALFSNCLAYETHDCDEKLNIFRLCRPERKLPQIESKHFEKGGYICIKNITSNAMAIFSYPVPTFRPSQVDPLHVDFWVNGVNLLRDGGSYSYNTDKKNTQYFNGSESHNTIQFDDYEPMPRIGRFLLSEWLSAQDVKFDYDKNFASAFYIDRFGASHRRSFTLNNKSLTVDDHIDGFNTRAVLRWRLKPGNWILKKDGVECGVHKIKINSEVAFDIKLINGFESRYYSERTEIPVLQVTILKKCSIRTEYFFQ